MTVGNVLKRTIQTGTGSASAFAFNSPVDNVDDLAVYTHVIATGVNTLQTRGGNGTYDYNVTINSSTEYATVTLNNNLPATHKIIIVRDLDITQETDYISGDPFSAETHETALDKNIMISQQLQEQIDRAIKVPVSDALPTLESATARANRFLKFDANGNLTTDIAPSDLGIGESIIFEGATADEYETTLRVDDPTGSDKTITLPNATGTVSLTDNTETLTNKTLTTPVIAQISNSGTLTLPTGTDDLVARTNTMTLTNKTLHDTAITVFKSTVAHTLGVSIGYDTFGHSLGVSIGMHAGYSHGSTNPAFSNDDGTPFDTMFTIGIGHRATEYSYGDGQYNIGIGNEALRYVAVEPEGGKHCKYNIAIGSSALKNTDFRGQYNIGIGLGAGTTITTGDGNTLLGYNAEPSSATANGELAITASNGASGTVTYMSGTANGAVTTVTVPNHLIVGGNLTVNGTTTTVNSTTITVDDPVFTLGGDTAPGSDDDKDRGIEFRWHDGSNAKVGFFGFDDSAGKFTFIPDATNTSEVFSGTAGTLVANLEGDVTGTIQTAAQPNITSLGEITELNTLRLDINNSNGGLNLDILSHPTEATFIQNQIGNLLIQNFVEDKDITIEADGRGNGGTNPYFKADGSTGHAILYYVDGSSNEKLTTNSTGIDITGGLTITDASDGSTSQTEIKLVQTTTSPALYDYGPIIRFFHENNAGESIEYSSIASQNNNYTDGSEAGRLVVRLKTGGADTLAFGLDHNLFSLLNKQQIHWYNFTGNHDGNMTPGTLSGDRTWTLPDASGTVITTGNLQPVIDAAKVKQTAYVNALLFG